MKQDIIYLLARSVLVLLLTGATTAAFAGDTDIHKMAEENYQALDKKFISFSSDLYQSLSSVSHYKHVHNIKTLTRKAKALNANGNVSDAIGLINRNISTVRNGVNTKSIIAIENMLLKANEYRTAESILHVIKQESDPSLISNVLFTFVEYEYAHNNWTKVTSLVEKISNDLPPADYQHAMFMEGMALQNLRKHRKALEVYKKISKNSEYYTASRINMAVSDFRQDWWTDAHIIIKDLLKDPSVRQNKELSDRLHTIIGYSFLQLEYFRNSRDSFRNVSLKSLYTNQALTGIALDAAYQKDYVGALNAARILQKNHKPDLETDESYLLLPYFYEKLHQNATASAGYTSAIQYYENRLRTINAAMQTDVSFYKSAITDGNPGIIKLNDEHIELIKYLPSSFFRQIRLLNSYRHIVKRMKNTFIRKEFKQLNNEFSNTILITTRAILKRKAGFITDYMNQCRYGLARMYDNSANNVK